MQRNRLEYSWLVSRSPLAHLPFWVLHFCPLRSCTESLLRLSVSFPNGSRLHLYLGGTQQYRGIVRSSVSASFIHRRRDVLDIQPATYYTKDHETVAYDDESNSGKIRITDYAQSSLGDVVFVELPAAGSQVKQGGTISLFLREPQGANRIQSIRPDWGSGER